MQLVTLDSLFQEKSIVDGYNSLIWSERYGPNGDFELKSNNVQAAITALPKESYVSLRDSTVPMVVEDHLIEHPKNDAPVVTITGRSFETVLERRASINALPGPNAAGIVYSWMMGAAKESDAAYKAMRVVLGDFPRYKNGSLVLDVLNPAVDPADAIPEIDLTLPADYSTLTTNQYEIAVQDLYTTVQGLIQANYHGIKSVRPKPGGSKVGIEIYNGADRSATVRFYARFDQFDTAKYLLSNRGSTNVGYVFGNNGAGQVYKVTGPSPSGLARRVLVVDDSGDDLTSSPSSVDIRKTRGLIELYKYNATALFDGEVAQQVADGYNKTYFLGDILQLVGEYGLYENVRVTEFIRTSDNTGEKAYPTFEAVT